jgi:hypothetical protein
VNDLADRERGPRVTDDGDEASREALWAGHVSRVYDFAAIALGEGEAAVQCTRRAFLRSGQRSYDAAAAARVLGFARSEVLEAAQAGLPAPAGAIVLDGLRGLGVQQLTILALRARCRLDTRELAVALHMSQQNVELLLRRQLPLAGQAIRCYAAAHHPAACATAKGIAGTLPRHAKPSACREALAGHLAGCLECGDLAADPWADLAALPRLLPPPGLAAEVLAGMPPAAPERQRAGTGRPAGRHGSRLRLVVGLAGAAIGGLAVAVVLAGSGLLSGGGARTAGLAGAEPSPSPAVVAGLIGTPTSTPPATPTSTAAAPPPATSATSPATLPVTLSTPAPLATASATNTATPTLTTEPAASPSPSATQAATATPTACAARLATNVESLNLIPGQASFFYVFNQAQCGSATFTVSSSEPWLSIDPTSGLLGSGRLIPVGLLAVPAKLPGTGEGSFAANLTISGAGSVTLRVVATRVGERPELIAASAQCSGPGEISLFGSFTDDFGVIAVTAKEGTTGEVLTLSRASGDARSGSWSVAFKRPPGSVSSFVISAADGAGQQRSATVIPGGCG